MISPLRPMVVDWRSTRVKPDVLVFEPVGGHGGMDFWNHSLCKALAQAGWRPLLLTSDAPQNPAGAYEVSEIYRGVFGDSPKWRRGLLHLGATFKALWFAKSCDVSLVHFHFFHIGVLQFIGVLIARIFGLRVIVSAHDVGSFRRGEKVYLLRAAYRLSSQIIVYSVRAKRKLIEKFGIQSKRIHIVPHGNYLGFLPTLPSKSASKAKFGFNDDAFVVLFFGQLKRVKRLDLLINAAGLARSSGLDRMSLLVAGSTSDTDLAELDDLVSKAGIRDAVQLHARYISNEEIPSYFAAADLTVLPYDNIYQSGVVLLAMTNGVPVLTSDIPGMLEVVRNGHTGLTFAAGDKEDLARKLIDIANGRWNLAEIAKQAQDYALTEHSWTKCGLATLSAYLGDIEQKAGFLQEEASAQSECES